MRPPKRISLLVFALMLSASTSVHNFAAAGSQASFQISEPRIRAGSGNALSDRDWAAPNNIGVFVRRLVNGRAVCLGANAHQAAAIAGRDTGAQLIALEPDSDPTHLQRTGLRIQLRATVQAMSFPLAITAFERAAAQWESLIRSNITIVVDVDFGPSAFGNEFDADVVSSTYSQAIGGNVLYP